MSFFSRNYASWVAITFSNTLDKKGSFEIGRKLARIDVLRLGFLISGCTMACLKGAGKQAELKQARESRTLNKTFGLSMLFETRFER